MQRLWAARCWCAWPKSRAAEDVAAVQSSATQSGHGQQCSQTLHHRLSTVSRCLVIGSADYVVRQRWHCDHFVMYLHGESMSSHWQRWLRGTAALTLWWLCHVSPRLCSKAPQVWQCTGFASQTLVVLHLQAQGLGEGDEHPPTLEYGEFYLFCVYDVCSICDGVFIADGTYPDGCRVAPAMMLDKTWILCNTGSVPWTPTTTKVDLLLRVSVLWNFHIHVHICTQLLCSSSSSLSRICIAPITKKNIGATIKKITIKNYYKT